MFDIKLPRKDGWKWDSALLDPGSCVNLISQLLVKELGWDTPYYNPILVRLPAVNEVPINTYGSHTVTIRLTVS